jgi:hypothetical protein
LLEGELSQYLGLEKFDQQHGATFKFEPNPNGPNRRVELQEQFDSEYPPSSRLQKKQDEALKQGVKKNTISLFD